MSNTYKKLIQDGRNKEAEDYLKENMANINLASAAGTFRQQMGELTKGERAIRASDLPPEEKRKRLDDLRRIKIEYANQFRTITEQIKRQDGRS